MKVENSLGYLCFDGGGTKVWRANDGRVLGEARRDAAGARRFFGEDVERGAGTPSSLQRRQQRLLINDSTPCDVHHSDRRLALGKCRSVDQIFMSQEKRASGKINA